MFFVRFAFPTTGDIPPDLARLHVLQLLDLRNNKLSGELPEPRRENTRAFFLWPEPTTLGNSVDCSSTGDVFVEAGRTGSFLFLFFLSRIVL